jgi:hypothetical protein
MNGFAGGGQVNYNCKLYRTRDGGDTWENTDLPFGYAINGVWMTDTNRVYICGDYGSILLYGDTININTGITDHHAYDNRLVCYPNPASEFLQIKIPEPYNKEDLLLYNSTGVLIRKISAIKTKVDISDLSRGVYFLRAGDMVGKFIKE